MFELNNDPLEDPLELIEETASTLEKDGRSMPIANANAFLNDWLQQLATDSDPTIVAVRNNVQKMLTMFAVPGDISPDIKPLMREISEQLDAIAATFPENDERRKNLSRTVRSLVIMAA